MDIERLIEDALKKDDRTRIAIIKKNEDQVLIDISRKYKRYINKSIIIGDVKKVKGLEFELVFVFTESMDRNELYISYSRSLKSLYVIKPSF